MRALVAVVAYNNGENVARTLARFPAETERSYDVIVVDDGSSDATAELIVRSGFTMLQHPTNRGIGAAIKSAVRHARDGGYDAICILAGNDKDDPQQVELLLEPLRRGEAEYVQGSRFAVGGAAVNTPVFRDVMIRVHARLLRLLTGFSSTDSLNGFRAYKLSIFDDPRIDIWQDWLDRYEYETYVHYTALKYRRAVEVGVTKKYPPRGRKRARYSHIRPVIDWWKILRPVPFLLLGLRR